MVVAAITAWHMMARAVMYYVYLDDMGQSSFIYRPRPAFSLRHYSWDSPLDVLASHLVAAVIIAFAIVLAALLILAVVGTAKWVWSGDSPQQNSGPYCSDPGCNCIGHLEEVFRDGEWHFQDCEDPGCKCPDFHDAEGKPHEL